MAELIDSWEDDGMSFRLEKRDSGALVYAYGEVTYEATFLAEPEMGARHAWLARELAIERKLSEQLMAKLRVAEAAPHSQLAREIDELAKGILDLTRRLTIAEKRTKEAEERLQSAVNLGEMWYQRLQRTLPLFNLAREYGWDGQISADSFFRASLEEGDAAAEKVAQLELNLAKERAATPAALGTFTPEQQYYDLGEICARCGGTRRDHLEENWEGYRLPCDGFLAEAQP